VQVFAGGRVQALGLLAGTRPAVAILRPTKPPRGGAVSLEQASAHQARHPRRLRLEQIPLYQLHRPDPKVPLADSLGTLVELKDEGKIAHIGISNVSESQLRAAQQITPVASVQNRYNAADRGSESMVDTCEQEQIAFLPWAPIQQTGGNPAVAEAAKRHGASPRQIALAWLLARSPQILPIPGTGSPEHAEANVAAASIELSADEVSAISGGA